MFWNKKRVTLKETRESLYRCRDFELSNLWQRSIFLSAFLVLCFTGYGFILIRILDIITEPAKSGISVSYLHLTATVIGILSLLFSMLWIMMGKGSKAWYEIYETAISAIEQEDELGMKNDYIMGNMQLHEKKQFSSNILSSAAGGFSVSRINIAIGQICFFVWIFVILIHSTLNLIHIICLLKSCDFTAGVVACLVASVILLIIAIVLPVILYYSKWVRSGYEFK